MLNCKTTHKHPFFWTVLWAIAHWLDNHLIDALTSQWHLFHQPNVMIADEIINFVIAMLFIVMPLFWLGALSWIGFRVGSAINGTGLQPFKIEKKLINPRLMSGF